MSREERAKKNRELMPQVAAWVDEYRQWGVTVIYAAENGVVVGKPQVEENVFTVPPNYFPNFRIKKKKSLTKKLWPSEQGERNEQTI